MMKLFIGILFMLIMLKFNKIIMFYYNLCFFASFMMLFFFSDSLFWSISGYFGIDLYSYMLVMLSLWILGVSMMSVYKDLDNKFKLLVFIIILMILLMFFFSMNVLLFYFFFEVSMIPIFFMIIYWGNNKDRISAAYYLLMYMLIISLPLLVYIYKLFMYLNSFSFILMKSYLLFYEMSFLEYLLIFGTFFIKLPIYMFHIWLPKAHVEAPVYGSMILAAILLKMGGIGILRMLVVFYSQAMKYNYIIFSISIVGGLMVSLICLVQVDLKSLVAYSSVVHMNFMLCSLMTMMKLGFIGGYIMMISHGLCSSGLFYLVNMFYSRTSSRLVLFNKGLIKFLPSVMLWWFYLCACNFSFPFSMNFLSEVFMISSILKWYNYSAIYLMLICFFSSAYSLYLFSCVCHGAGFYEIGFNSVGYVKEYLILYIHSIPLFMLMFNMIYFY